MREDEELTIKPLSGLRVIDLTHVLAGPYCTYQLGLLGAEVIKVESPRGDMTRPWGGEEEQINLGLGTGFVAQNAGKRSIVIDIKDLRGSAVVQDLVKSADIFVENYRPGKMLECGLDFDRLSSINSELIYTSISAFGQNGPHGHRPGFDDVIQATSGFMSINIRDDGPIRTGGPVLDYATGMHATSAVLAALMLREKTGKSQHIDISMQDVTMLLMNRHTSIAATTGVPLPPLQDREGPLLGRYLTRDGYVMLAGYRASHKRTIFESLGLTEYSSMSSAQLNSLSEQIESDVERVLKSRTTAEWDEVFSKFGVVAGGVKDLIEVLATGQPEARDLLTTVNSSFGNHQVSTIGYKLNDDTLGPGTHIPLLGEQTEEVLLEVGYSKEKISELFNEGIIM
jgi:crotonobetainyl-CoA:carnitine CoA-transferase CaiB-like acyl-CoA transferase|tara:strand:- start:663 stop:1856 length:1194 start_codon:yes stop_codon:yes gene_type:complete